MQVSDDFRKMMAGYGLATVKVRYRFADYPSIIAPPIVFQTFDVAPKFPRILMFLDFWNKQIEGRLEQVLVAHSRLIKPTEIDFEKDLRLN